MEDIDSVRKIANMATGRLAARIIEALLKKSGYAINVIYIHGKGAFQPQGLGAENVRRIEVKNTSDLEREVRQLMTTEKVDYFISAMAVADHRPQCVSSRQALRIRMQEIFAMPITDEEKERLLLDMVDNPPRLDNSGKISSSVSPVIFTEPTPKVLPIVKQIQPWTFLVGFKLLSKESDGDLFEIGFGTIRGEARCNMVVGNYLNLIRSGAQEALFIYSEKTFERFEGRNNIAEMLVERMLMRGQTKHARSVGVGSYDVPAEVYEEFQDIGERLFAAGYLPEVINPGGRMGTYGNMSILRGCRIIVSGRNVHKGRLSSGDICFIERVTAVEEPSVYAEVAYRGIIKPSIDSCIHHEIYRIKKEQGRKVWAIIHIHTDKLFAGIPLTACNYPCGTLEELQTILEAVEQNPDQDIIQLYKHGLIVMGESLEECRQKIDELFAEGVSIEPFDAKAIDHQAISSEWERHYKEMNPEIYPMRMDYKRNTFIVRRGEEGAGIIFIEKDEADLKFVLFTTHGFQKKGLGIGQKILSILELLAGNVGADNLMVITKDLCGVAGYYLKQGFTQVPSGNEFIILKRKI